ncbi:hypothetical protein T484DRAFT_1905614, partial [Baffinella frigidus]
CWTPFRSARPRATPRARTSWRRSSAPTPRGHQSGASRPRGTTSEDPSRRPSAASPTRGTTSEAPSRPAAGGSWTSDAAGVLLTTLTTLTTSGGSLAASDASAVRSHKNAQCFVPRRGCSASRGGPVVARIGARVLRRS